MWGLVIVWWSQPCHRALVAQARSPGFNHSSVVLPLKNYLPSETISNREPSFCLCRSKLSSDHFVSTSPWTARFMTQWHAVVSLTHLEELFSGESSEFCQVAILCCMVCFLGHCEEEGGCGGGWPFSSVEGTNVFHCWCQLCKSCVDLGQRDTSKKVKMKCFWSESLCIHPSHSSSLPPSILHPLPLCCHLLQSPWLSGNDAGTLSAA